MSNAQPDPAFTGGETILVVDDDEPMRESCVQVLEEAGFTVLQAASPTDAEPLLLREAIDLVVTDLRMPDGGGARVIEVTRDVAPETPIILITAFPTVESAVDAFKHGVVDYLPKPFSGEQLLESVQHALGVSRARDRVELLQRMGPIARDVPEIVGNSDRMREMLAEVHRVAPFDAHVLITGETGTGKELVARLVHRLSPRARGPFLAQNCAAMPENLLEAELFGYERGAFTGAATAHPGLLEQSTPGTLFLDEVGDMPLTAQAKLLRALEEKSCRRVGAVTSRPIDVRIVCATHRDLRAEVRAGRFREDVFYRLAGLEVKVPPLRERTSDIALLAAHFLGICQAKTPRPVVGFSDEALDLLSSHTWPGNVRELQNAVQKALAHTAGPLIVGEDVFASGAVPRSTTDAEGPLRSAVQEFEKSRLAEVLREHEGNVTHAARALGVHRTTLQRLMRKLGMR